MQRLEVSGAVRPLLWSLGVKGLNDPLGEPGHTPLYVGLLSAWGSVDGDYTCPPSPLFVGGFLKWGLLREMNG